MVNLFQFHVALPECQIPQSKFFDWVGDVVGDCSCPGICKQISICHHVHTTIVSTLSLSLSLARTYCQDAFIEATHMNLLEERALVEALRAQGMLPPLPLLNGSLVGCW